ncbi:hypothetical protein QPK87_02480 [Kamptonema cortianum]|uniref:Uncharacterized protein n=1 Tax=Geitlerinema calcuttense NRMC-F 0142 TaxID=2922238 RepID=A0ABT7M170_9CYAN|nr:hypothetical protein [Geitlerinema calcuttense]MDK3155452.1 hypothetical protein [Kamptonema cortianum]MDL5056791.1 hypothetical protein [Geitlerinema calcuttense NRMC-F 0142]
MSRFERVSLILISIGLTIQAGAFCLQVDQYMYHKSQTSLLPTVEADLGNQQFCPIASSSN